MLLQVLSKISVATKIMLLVRCISERRQANLPSPILPLTTFSANRLTMCMVDLHTPARVDHTVAEIFKVPYQHVLHPVSILLNVHILQHVFT